MNKKVVQGIAGAVFGLVMVMVFWPRENAPKTEAEIRLENCSDSIEAMVQVQEAIRRQLKSPSTAKFDWPRIQKIGDCAYWITGTVRAQNSFGATLAQNYSGRALYRNDRWSTGDVHLKK